MLNIQPVAATAESPISVTIDASQINQTIENFGASDAWSMDPLGKEWSEENKNRVADLLFSVEKGIGLSSWRFNIGAGSTETDQTIISNPWRRSESFKQTESGPYDWSKQAGQQWFLDAAEARGVDTLIAFVNSPPVWMTKNGHAQPDASVGSTNLNPSYIDDFAIFVSDVLEHFKDEKGIEFDYISPINEPTWDWNKAGQEANRYNNEDIKSVIHALYDELSERNLGAKISAPDGVEITSLLDDSYYQQFMATSTNANDNKQQYSGGANSLNVGKYREYIKDLLGDSEIAGKIDHKIASHSYWSDHKDAVNGDRLGYLRDLLWENLQEMDPLVRYWVTEYCILGSGGDLPGNGRDLGIDPALVMARTIHYDLTRANASAWQWWTAVSKEDYKDGLIYTDYKLPGDEQTIYESKMLWGMGNFSKFIRPGAKRIGVLGLNDNEPYGLMGSAYIHEQDRKITNVYVNNSNEAKQVSIQIEQLPEGYEVYQLTPYVTSESLDLAEQSMILPNKEGSFVYTLPAKSIVTLQGEYYPVDEAPKQPNVISIVPLNKAAQIKIDGVAGAQAYKVKYGTAPGDLTQVSESFLSTTFTLSNLVNNTNYYLAVTALNENGESLISNEVMVTPSLIAPQDVTVFPSDGGFEVTFTSDPNVPDYVIQWGTESGKYQDSFTAAVNGKTKLSHIVRGLENGSTYYIAIHAQDGDEEGPVSTEAEVVPKIDAPNKLFVIPGNEKAQVEFSDVEGAESFELEYGLSELNTMTDSEYLVKNNMTISNLTNQQEYAFQVTSEGVGGFGAPTQPVIITPTNEIVIWEDTFNDTVLSADYNQDVSKWGVEEGILKHQSGGDHQGELSIKNRTIIDGTITAIAKHSSPGADWGIVFRGTDYKRAYSFGFENDVLFMRKNGENILAPLPYTVKLGEIYELKVELEGSHIQAYLDGDLKFELEDTMYSSGMIGFHSWADAAFTYFKASRPATPMKAPQLYAVKPGDHRMQLTYSEVEGAESYKVKYGTQSGVYTHEAEGSLGNAVINGLENEQRYYFVVEAVQGSTITTSNELSATPRALRDPQLMYYVDAGDGSVFELEEGEAFGVYNGTEDQAYGEDPVTGAAWGYVADDDKTWAKSDMLDAYDTIRQYDGDQNGKGLSYKFTLPNGTYKVILGFDDPWDDNNRAMDILINGTTKASNYIIGSKRESKQFDAVVTNGELTVKMVKQSNTKPMISWIKVEKELLYYVDAGDSSKTTLEEGEEFGVRNTVEDQSYQQDPTTGYKWGYIADEGKTWANENETKWESVRQYDGDTNGNGLSYQFEVPNGKYKLELGFDDPWDDANRMMKVNVEGEDVLVDYVIGQGRDIKRIVDVEVSDGELNVKIIKSGNSKPMISWIAVYYDQGTSGIPTIKSIKSGENQATLYFDETINASYQIEYGTAAGQYTHSVVVPGNLSQYTVSGLDNNVTYHFVMKTIRVDHVSEASQELTAKPTGSSDPNVYYYVDAGAQIIQDGVLIGIKQSLADQPFGKDSVTGFSWGYIADDDLTWAKSDETDPYLSIRQYDGDEMGKGLAYHFEVPEGKYKIEFGFDDPWDHSGRIMDILIEHELVLEEYVTGDKREIKEFIAEVKDGLLEVKLVKRGNDKPAVGWIKVTYLSQIDPTDPTPTPTASPEPTDAVPTPTASPEPTYVAPIPTANPTPVAPKAEIDSNGEVNVQPVIDAKGSTTVQLAAETLNKALERILDGKLKIKVKGTEDAREVKVDVPVEKILANESKLNQSIEVDTGLAAVTISTDFIAKHAADARSVSITVIKVDITRLPADIQAKLGGVNVYDFTLEIDGKKVSQFNGSNDVQVALSYTLQNGENPHKLIVYYINDSSELETVMNGRYNPETGKVEFKPKHFSNYAAAYSDISFKDVNAAWAKDPIEGLAARGIIQGIGEERFSPEGLVTRAEFITMLMNLFDLTDANATSTFSDVKEGAWYYDEVATASQLGIISGRPDGSFGIQDKITRQDMAVMAYKVMEHIGLKTSETGESTFIDHRSISKYAQRSVAVMQAAGIINGKGNGIFAPLSEATRAEAAVVIYKIFMRMD
ncbi:hypothetical protein BK133_17465 [Paenibacillus sp. FSL H8-0548]|nr:hypothetical protein BK133_17465 [Paenibacillus sp. FSL H8-0548]